MPFSSCLPSAADSLSPTSTPASSLSPFRNGRILMAITSMKQNRVKSALKAGQPQIGTWLSLASPLAARFMARAGFQWLTVDVEHSPVNWETAALMFGAIADAGGVPLARVPA